MISCTTSQYNGSAAGPSSPSSGSEDTTQIHLGMLTLLSAGMHPRFLLHHNLAPIPFQVPHTSDILNNVNQVPHASFIFASIKYLAAERNGYPGRFYAAKCP